MKTSNKTSNCKTA